MHGIWKRTTLALALAGSCCAGASRADEYPSRPVRIIVPYAPGGGADTHLVTELFSSKAGLKMTHIPYRGTALAVADLIGGQVSVVFSDPVSVLPHLQAGTLRGLAVTSTQRSAVAPDLPTIAES